MISKPIHVNSTLLASVAFDSSESLLELEFCDGTTYRYAAVSEPLYKGLLAAESKGAYFNQKIRGQLPYTRVASVK